VFTRDGVAINELAIKKLIGGELKDPNNNDRVIVYPGLYPTAVDVKCFSHTLDLCGGQYKKRGISYGRLEGTELRTFYIHINGLFSGASNKPNKRWEVIMHSTMPSVSATRWYSKEEMYDYVLRHFSPEEGRNETLITWVNNVKDDEAFDGAHLNYLYKTLVPEAPGFDAHVFRLIHIQLAVVVDISKPLRECTYLLEGDGPLVFLLPEIIRRCELDLELGWNTMDFPNIQKVIDSVKDHRPPIPEAPQPQIEDNKDAWIYYCKSLAQPCYDYFKEKVVGHPTMDLFRAAMYGNPEYMCKYSVTSTQELRDAVQPLVAIKFITKELVNSMVQELAEYQLVCDEASTWTTLTYQQRLEKIEDYWAVKRTKLAAWTEFARTCMLLQPSSACVERAFSILKYIFTDQQRTSLGDLIETTLMLRYNRKDLAIENE